MNKLAALLTLTLLPLLGQPSWARHAIHGGAKGADGFRVADINGDGLLDGTTAWERTGEVYVYTHPGYALVNGEWPRTLVLSGVAKGEDAFFVDLDRDGHFDVVSSHESGTVEMSFGPNWNPVTVEASRTFPWLYATAIQIDGLNGPDIVAGSKSPNQSIGVIGWFAAPPDARQGAEWVFHKMAGAGWVMSLIPADMDGDGDQDVLVTDRAANGTLSNEILCNKHPGVGWLENPGVGNGQEECWPSHQISTDILSPMFADIGDVDGDGLLDVVSAVSEPQTILYSRRLNANGLVWQNTRLKKQDMAGRPKAVGLADIDADGRMDIVLSTVVDGTTKKKGIMWYSFLNGWHDVSAVDLGKYDNITVFDVDGDGDLDIASTEERVGYGVVWWENPLIP